MTFISTESNTQFSEPSKSLARKKSCSAPTPDLFPTSPGPLIFMATREATRVDDDDDDDDDNDAAEFWPGKLVQQERSKRKVVQLMVDPARFKKRAGSKTCLNPFYLDYLLLNKLAGSNAVWFHV